MIRLFYPIAMKADGIERGKVEMMVVPGSMANWVSWELNLSLLRSLTEKTIVQWKIDALSFTGHHVSRIWIIKLSSWSSLWLGPGWWSKEHEDTSQDHGDEPGGQSWMQQRLSQHWRYREKIFCQPRWKWRGHPELSLGKSVGLLLEISINFPLSIGLHNLIF